MELKAIPLAMPPTLRGSCSTDLETLLCVSDKVKPYHMTSCLNGVNTNASLSFKLDDENRIVLKPIPGAVDCQGDYINACYIDVREHNTRITNCMCDMSYNYD